MVLLFCHLRGVIGYSQELGDSIPVLSCYHYDGELPLVCDLAILEFGAFKDVVVCLDISGEVVS